MIIRAVTVWVRSDSVEAFEAATIVNHRGSIMEPGVLRFDVLRSTDHPGEYLLYEAYESEEAASAHKQTTHYKKWKAAVEPWMEKQRDGRSFEVVTPTNPQSWRKEQLAAR